VTNPLHILHAIKDNKEIIYRDKIYKFFYYDQLIYYDHISDYYSTKSGFFTPYDCFPSDGPKYVKWLGVEFNEEAVIDIINSGATQP